MEKNLKLYGYFEGDLLDDYIEDLFYDFLEDKNLSYFGFSLFKEGDFLLDLDGVLFSKDLSLYEEELYQELLEFCHKYRLRFIELDK